ncbi:MAG: hypothetical protein K0R06_2591, partial [Clostridium sp.]|nr:hypothetical protein [Clostridium sp.]
MEIVSKIEEKELKIEEKIEEKTVWED